MFTENTLQNGLPGFKRTFWCDTSVQRLRDRYSSCPLTELACQVLAHRFQRTWAVDRLPCCEDRGEGEAAALFPPSTLRCVPQELVHKSLMPGCLWMPLCHRWCFVIQSSCPTADGATAKFHFWNHSIKSHLPNLHQRQKWMEDTPNLLRLLLSWWWTLNYREHYGRLDGSRRLSPAQTESSAWWKSTLKARPTYALWVD